MHADSTIFSQISNWVLTFNQYKETRNKWSNSTHSEDDTVVMLTLYWEVFDLNQVQNHTGVKA